MGSAYGGEAARLDDKLGAAYVTLGKIHEDSGQHDLAVQEFQKALTLDQRNADALDGIAHSYENAGRLKEAEEAFRKAAALRPDSWIGYDSLALFFDRQNRLQEGIEQLKHAIELTPDNSQLYLNLGAFYLDSGDEKLRPQAEAALKKSISLTPSYPAYANLGSLYCDQKRYSACAETTGKALEINGNNYLVWGNMVTAYLWLGNQGLGNPEKLQKAIHRTIELLEAQVKETPKDNLSHAVLASLYAREKQKDQALSQIQTALALSATDPPTLVYVGVAYENLGDRRLALQYIDQALSAGFPADKIRNDPELQELLKDKDFRLHEK